MILTGTYQLTAAVNPDKRRIVGQVVPFGEEGTPGSRTDAAADPQGIRLVVEAGGLTWDDADLPKLTDDHGGDIIGKAVTLDASESGLVGAFKITATHAGDDALALASDGLKAGLSIEAETDTPPEPDADGVYRLTADNPARLTRVALVEHPAFATAAVHSVAATDTPPAQGEANQKETTMSDTASTAGEAVVTTEVHAEQAPPVNPKHIAATQVTREPFPYGHPGSSGRSFFADMLASRTDERASQRTRQAHAMWIKAADEPISKANAAVIPNQYDNNNFVDLPRAPRVIADSIKGVAVSSAQPILVPSVTSVYADGGSGEPVAAHSEGVHPASGEVVLAYKTYTPAPYSGKLDINREALDSASPQLDSILLGFLKESYNTTTEAAAVTSITGTSGIDTGTAAHNADADVKAAALEKAIRLEIAQFGARRYAPPNVVWAAPDNYQQLVAYDSTDGRAILPYMGPMNSSGQTGSAAMDLGILGVKVDQAFAMTQYKTVVANTNDIIRYESPLLQFRWEEAAGPEHVRFVAWAYFLVGVLQPKGVSLITQAQS